MGRSGSKKWDGLTQKNVGLTRKYEKDWLEKMQGADPKKQEGMSLPSPAKPRFLLRTFTITTLKMKKYEKV